jgi:hypothetical protein
MSVWCVAGSLIISARSKPDNFIAVSHILLHVTDYKSPPFKYTPTCTTPAINLKYFHGQNIGSTALLEKLVVAHLVKFPAFHGSYSFIIVITKAQQWSI